MVMEKDRVCERRAELISGVKVTHTGHQSHPDNSQQSNETDIKQVKEVRRIRQHDQTHNVTGIVVYGDRVYTVHYKGLTVYCYSHDHELSCKYEHSGGENTIVQGMCLMMDGHTPMLVIGDFINQAVVWIKVKDDFTMDHLHTQQLGYGPRGLYNDRGQLMISDSGHHKIHRYMRDGHLLGVITLPDDIIPCNITGHGDGDQYVITDAWNNQVLVITSDGHLKKRYKGDIHGVELGRPGGITTDDQGRFIVCDNPQHQVLMLDGDGDEVRQLLQPHHLMNPGILYLDIDHHRLYVSGSDPEEEEEHMFVYNYTILTANHKSRSSND